MSPRSMSRTIEVARVIYHHEGDGWWAESPDLEGWSAAGDTSAGVRQLAMDGVRFARAFEASRPESGPGRRDEP